MKIKINTLTLSLVLYLLSATHASASGCRSTYLEGTLSPYGRIPLVSSSLTAISSFILKSEGSANNDNKDKRAAVDSGFAASGVYFFIAMHGLCRTVERKEYEKLIAERDKLLKEGKKFEDLPYKLKHIAPIPSREAYETEISEWKRRQRFLQVIVTGLESLAVYEQAQQADRDGTKYFAYASLGAIAAMVATDYDSVWGKQQPSWIDFNIVTTRINSTILPMVTVTSSF